VNRILDHPKISFFSLEKLGKYWIAINNKWRFNNFCNFFDAREPIYIIFITEVQQFQGGRTNQTQQIQMLQANTLTASKMKLGGRLLKRKKGETQPRAKTLATVTNSFAPSWIRSYNTFLLNPAQEFIRAKACQIISLGDLMRAFSKHILLLAFHKAQQMVKHTLYVSVWIDEHIYPTTSNIVSHYNEHPWCLNKQQQFPK
jgi:hypothetical protein